MAKRLRVLTVCHNHPSLHPGGTEILSHELFRAMKAGGAVDGMFLACTNQIHRERRPGTVFQTLGRSADEMVLWAGHFDRFFLSQVDLHAVVPEMTRLLQDFRPDVVHVHHTLLLGVEILFLIRRVLPECRLVMTLHDYYPICPNDGQMVKAQTHELCERASPDACRGCFPDRSADQFLLREKHIKTLLGCVDQFIAPSQFLRDRYVAWGLPEDRIGIIRNGRPAVPAAAAAATAATAATATGAERQQRNTFAYFGNLNPYKGVLVLLDAARRLTEAGCRDFKVVINGGMPFQSDAFREEVAQRLAGLQDVVVHRGPYQAADIPALMAEVDWVVMPSIWWENAPLVIQEAFQHRRPVICSNIGGMVEHARDGAGALNFRVGDSADLARVMRTAMETPGLWRRVAAAIPAVPTIDKTAAEHVTLYKALCADVQAAFPAGGRAPQPAGASATALRQRQ